MQYARRGLVSRYGEPRSADGTAQQLVVLAMGKLGGGELNFSSDVDLVLLFPEHGDTDGARSIANEEFFMRLAQAIIRLLGAPTFDGFVLRVDLRLRPFGDSGPLVASFASFEDYLPRHGREWERYAYVKARAVTALDSYAEIYASAVRPFVYRRYLDYGVFESLREMKALIEREVERRELADHVKLGPGGIREVEFIVQAFQIIRGGQDRRLQTQSLLSALELLDTWKRLPSGMTDELRAAYTYLRRLENRLQMIGDAQVHSLPEDALTRERIALAMGVSDWLALVAELNRHRELVSRHFRLVVCGVAEQDPNAVRIDLGRFWDTQAETAVLAESLARAGFAASDEAARLLLEMRSSSLVRKLDEPGRKRLQALLPTLLADVARMGNKDPEAHGPPGALAATAGGTSAKPLDPEAQLQVLRRVLRVIDAIGQRSTYFALLHENAAARARLVDLCGHGDFLTQQIASHPLLLDELIDERLAELPSRASLEGEVRSRLEQLSDDEPERQVEALRLFQRAAIFRVAVADLTGRIPVMRV
ncbi:MAG TPA: bifunctional [glutamate--ammonia ligase]-adenylyl-L-tyrosine phosphorylase/[glutamate--ammonia-ligase] adenylyltransferase, partial [Polyangiaceae bacterium]|nr:bifunctional [glutamate--ammonia ligase]-adenylyl-L-tyrosine phosphorylase/[glutamate--ammonia-ligase] adenylyltransferase [Polyangiaceae bacterium]